MRDCASEVRACAPGTTAPAALALDEPASTAYLFSVPSPDPLPFTPLETAALLPDRFRRWFAARGWSPREHQLALLAKASDDRFRAADRADRRRQDAGRISADAGGAVFSRRLKGRWREEPHLHRPQRQTHRRPPHPLHLAAESARGRHRAQSGDADRRDGAADQGRDPHRRHAGVAAAAAAALSAGHSAHHAGATGAAAVLRRRAVSVLLAQAHRARRAACARHLQARRSAVARSGAAVAARAGDARDRAVRDGGRAGIAGALSGAAARRQGSLRRYRRGRRRGGARSSRCSTPRSGCPGPATPRAMRSAKCTS